MPFPNCKVQRRVSLTVGRPGRRAVFQEARNYARAPAPSSPVKWSLAVPGLGVRVGAVTEKEINDLVMPFPRRSVQRSLVVLIPGVHVDSRFHQTFHDLQITAGRSFVEFNHVILHRSRLFRRHSTAKSEKTHDAGSDAISSAFAKRSVTWAFGTEEPGECKSSWRAPLGFGRPRLSRVGYAYDVNY